MYEKFGTWIRNCYGTPVLEVLNPPGDENIILKLPRHSRIDRIMLQEDISSGQAIIEFIIYEKKPKSKSWTFLYQNKQGVGNKKIVIFNKIISAESLKIFITKSLTPSFGEVIVSAYDSKYCSIPSDTIPKPTKSQLRQQSDEIVAFIVFNMATYSKDGDPGCDIDNWNQKFENATGPT